MKGRPMKIDARLIGLSAIISLETGENQFCLNFVRDGELTVVPISEESYYAVGDALLGEEVQEPAPEHHPEPTVEEPQEEIGYYQEPEEFPEELPHQPLGSIPEDSGSSSYVPEDDYDSPPRGFPGTGGVGQG